MRLFEDSWGRDDLPRGGVVTIGNFDGVHLGQRELFEIVVVRAREQGREAVAVTFEPHPLTVLAPERAPLRLATREQKRRWIGECGLDALVEIDFTREFSRTSAAAFVEEFLVERLEITEVHVGEAFSFGSDREGDLRFLRAAGERLGFSAQGVSEVREDGRAISSTRIRRAVGEGEMAQAGAMLGRPFTLDGEVVRGEARGRGLGWPTANLAVDNELLPADGVYATRARIDSEGPWRGSVTNVGTSPTFEGTSRRVETHLLDLEDDLYGSRVELAFFARLRGERRFGSPAELSEQIRRDVQSAREYLGGVRC